MTRPPQIAAEVATTTDAGCVLVRKGDSHALVNLARTVASKGSSLMAWTGRPA